MADVLISADDLATFATSEPCVIIDTRNPDAYAAGHIPGAVNIHEIFTFLATSTPEGMEELKKKYADKTIFGVTENIIGDEVNYYVKLVDEKNWTTVKIDNYRNM